MVRPWVVFVGILLGGTTIGTYLVGVETGGRAVPQWRGKPELFFVVGRNEAGGHMLLVVAEASAMVERLDGTGLSRVDIEKAVSEEWPSAWVLWEDPFESYDFSVAEPELGTIATELGLRDAEARATGSKSSGFKIDIVDQDGSGERQAIRLTVPRGNPNSFEYTCDTAARELKPSVYRWSRSSVVATALAKAAGVLVIGLLAVAGVRFAVSRASGA